MLKNEVKSHHLIRQQQGYYTVLSDIRHRNPSVYEMYNKDKKFIQSACSPDRSLYLHIDNL